MIKLALVGATGMVGRKVLQVLEERQFAVGELIPVASERSVGEKIYFKGDAYSVVSLETALAKKPQVAIFSAGGDTAWAWAPKFAAQGCFVIDNSSAFRMMPDKKLIVPEINGETLGQTDTIIPNPNCSTIQMVMVLAPLQKQFGLDRVIVSTYQSITGTGMKAVQQLQDEISGKQANPVYPHPIHQNCLPHCDVFLENGYTKEEMKLILETRKILNQPDLAVTATAVRVPVMGGHSESINITLRNPAALSEIREILANTPGVILSDNPTANLYPMPLTAHDRDEVFVGRIRVDESAPNTFNMWVVADNLRKGAATNAVQIAELLVKKGLV
jgi:aspartate-semialdehyde dehydrogenase